MLQHERVGSTVVIVNTSVKSRLRYVTPFECRFHRGKLEGVKRQGKGDALANTLVLITYPSDDPYE